MHWQLTLTSGGGSNRVAKRHMNVGGTAAGFTGSAITTSNKLFLASYAELVTTLYSSWSGTAYWANGFIQERPLISGARNTPYQFFALSQNQIDGDRSKSNAVLAEFGISSLRSVAPDSVSCVVITLNGSPSYGNGYGGASGARGVVLCFCL